MFALQLRKRRALRGGVIHPGAHSQDMGDAFFEPGESIQTLSVFLAPCASQFHHHAVVSVPPCPQILFSVGEKGDSKLTVGWVPEYYFGFSPTLLSDRAFWAEVVCTCAVQYMCSWGGAEALNFKLFHFILINVT